MHKDQNRQKSTAFWGWSVLVHGSLMTWQQKWNHQLLTWKNIPFKLETEQEKVFQHLKEDLTQADSLAYFDPKAETCILADANPVGLGAVFNSEKRVIYYASHSLLDIKRCY